MLKIDWNAFNSIALPAERDKKVSAGRGELLRSSSVSGQVTLLSPCSSAIQAEPHYY